MEDQVHQAFAHLEEAPLNWKMFQWKLPLLKIAGSSKEDKDKDKDKDRGKGKGKKKERERERG